MIKMNRFWLLAAGLLVIAAPARAQTSDSAFAVSTGGQSLFRVNVNGTAFFGGTYNSGATDGAPVGGAGTRMFWYPGKAAFRAGAVNGTQWDDANIGLYSTAFGSDVRALGDNAIAVGNRAVAANTGTIAMGEDVTATGANSVVLGYRASSSTGAGAPRLGTFVFGDRSTNISGDTIHPTVTNSATWRVANGFFIYTSSDLSTGVNVTAGGGSWNTVSDRAVKENFQDVDGEHVLLQLNAVPVRAWNYIAQGRGVRHIGPMAQDWERAFGLSGDSLTINTGDFDGVNLAGIQALTTRTDRLREDVATLRGENAALRERNGEQERRIQALEQSNAHLQERMAHIEALLAGQGTAPAQP
jgi:hypothetical protein